VAAGVNPLFPKVHELRNAARLGGGPAVKKYTGHGGKLGASDASAEFFAHVAGVFDRAGIPWQVATLGAVGVGGGGTIAKYLAHLGIQVIDVGIPVLSMHAPVELSAKKDLEGLVRAYRAFFLHDDGPSDILPARQGVGRV